LRYALLLSLQGKDEAPDSDGDEGVQDGQHGDGDVVSPAEPAPEYQHQAEQGKGDVLKTLFYAT